MLKISMKFQKKSLAVMLSLILLGVSVSFTAEKAQDFKLKDLRGKQFALKKQLGQGPIVLDFWATWCKPCVNYLPKIQKIYEKYKSEGVQIYGINVDGARNRSKINPFVNSLNLTFPILLDENSEVGRRYRVTGIPTTVLISSDG